MIINEVIVNIKIVGSVNSAKILDQEVVELTPGLTGCLYCNRKLWKPVL